MAKSLEEVEHAVGQLSKVSDTQNIIDMLYTLVHGTVSALEETVDQENLDDFKKKIQEAEQKYGDGDYTAAISLLKSAYKIATG